MGEWKITILGELVDIGSSKRIFYKEYVDEGIPFYRSKEVIEKHNRNIISTELHISNERFDEIKKKFGVPVEGDMLLTSVGTLGIPYIVEKGENFYFKDGNLTWFRNFDENLLNHFLYYWIISPIGKGELDMVSIGSTQAALTIIGLKSLEINLPPFPEQKAIADVLSSLDDKIDLLHRQNKTLEGMAETLFRQRFVEEAQDDWEESILNNILSVKGGTTPSTKNSEYWDGEIYWTTPRDLSGNKNIYMFDTGRKITEQGLAKISSGLLPVGTILLSSRAPIGYLTMTNIQVAINQGYIAILDNKGFSKYFLYLWVKNNLDYIISNANGSTFLEISKSVFKSLEIVKPPADLRDNFDKQVIPIFQKIKTNSIQIRTLEKLRDTLLPKLISGEVQMEYEN